METIYFIQEGFDGNLKIGKVESGNLVNNRLLDMQTGNSKKLNLIAITNGEDGTEKRIHEKFKQFSMRGEWFFPAEQILEYIKIHTQSILKKRPKIDYDLFNFIEKKFVNYCKRNCDVDDNITMVLNEELKEEKYFIIPYKDLIGSTEEMNRYYYDIIFKKFNLKEYDEYIKPFTYKGEKLNCLLIPFKLIELVLQHDPVVG